MAVNGFTQTETPVRDLIALKRDGAKLTAKQIDDFVTQVIDKRAQESQIGKTFNFRPFITINLMLTLFSLASTWFNPSTEFSLGLVHFYLSWPSYSERETGHVIHFHVSSRTS